jgi:hypothetical protein
VRGGGWPWGLRSRSHLEGDHDIMIAAIRYQTVMTTRSLEAISESMEGRVPSGLSLSLIRRNLSLTAVPSSQASTMPVDPWARFDHSNSSKLEWPR